ncbi:FAD-dependent oxidoreductase [Clostridium tetanomorphum]|uniref:FAD-dependent oxidoreductase n=1 Tax=Clostridium tetanomorphum TaxID=1553 RepID=A0A923EA50_CLOTT|nr:FAD-dependent oxidoreductase [Clostridium tetanomorphum]MBC2397531.1 FAD-dependent oxidoreductase [Clostridium tetanomorphum]NRZ95718.1 NAD(P)H-nitrite reductase large subunit/rubredoxin [Clostridium tetanomorphum]
MSKKWKCLICGVSFDGDNPPGICPVCGAPADQFVEVLEDTITQKDTVDHNFLIIGNGAAGFYAADAIRMRNKDCNIKIISSESYTSYYRPSLSDYLSNDNLDDNFYLAKKEWYEDNNIDLLLNTTVKDIDPSNKSITLSNNSTLVYDKLIIANGSHNFIPLIPGNNKKGIFSLKDLKDANNIKGYIKKCKNAVVIGGGLLGLEAAGELKKLGLNVTVVEFFKRLLPRQLDEKGAKILKECVDNSGVNVILDDSLSEIIGDSHIKSIKLKSGNIIDTDILLFSVGIRANKELADQCGIKTDKAIVVNEKMETNIKDIYACGDVAEFNGRNYGNWSAAVKMGKIAGANAVGENEVFKDFTSAIIFNSMGAKMFSCGDYGNSDEQLCYENSEKGFYKKLFFKNNMLIGAMMLGSISTSGKTIEAIKNNYTKDQVLRENLIY